MVCDYYIVKNLRLYFQNIVPLLYIQVEYFKEDFYSGLDEDEHDYEEKYEEYIKYILTPEMKPIIIYENNKFINSRLENKYMSVIQERINIYNNSNETCIGFNDIIDIIKIETRYKSY
jgi:hypothetical protein